MDKVLAARQVSGKIPHQSVEQPHPTDTNMPSSLQLAHAALTEALQLISNKCDDLTEDQRIDFTDTQEQYGRHC